MFMQTVDRELLHFAWGFFVCEALWLLFYFLLRLKRKGQLPRYLTCLAPDGYLSIYIVASVCIVGGSLFHELWDLTWGNNPAWKSWVDVFFWALGVFACVFLAYRKRYWILTWVN